MDKQQPKNNADNIRYSLASHIVHALQGWRDVRIVSLIGEVGGYEVEDTNGVRYEVRLTVTAKRML